MLKELAEEYQIMVDKIKDLEQKNIRLNTIAINQLLNTNHSSEKIFEAMTNLRADNMSIYITYSHGDKMGDSGNLNVKIAIKNSLCYHINGVKLLKKYLSDIY